MMPREMNKVVLYVLLSALVFSTMEVALKIAGAGLDAFQITFLRFLIGGAFLLPFALLRLRQRRTRITGRDMGYMLLLGTICIPLGMIFFQLGVERSNAATAAVLFCLNPVFTMFFAHFFTEEKLNRRKLLALGVGILGIVFMVAPWDINPGDSLAGAGLSTLAALVFGFYSALGRRTIRRIGGLPQTSINFLLGSLVMLPLLWALDKPVIAGIGGENLGIVLFAGVIVTGFGYLFYFLAMEHAGAFVASIVFFVKPGIAPIFAVLLLSETITANGFLGIALVFASSFLNLREQWAPRGAAGGVKK